MGLVDIDIRYVLSCVTGIIMFRDYDDQMGLHRPCFGPVELIGPTNSVMGLLGLSGVIIFSNIWSAWVVLCPNVYLVPLNKY
jgi:hypothetical protein